MRRAVHALVIVRRRGDRLIQTLEALRSQSRKPDSITVVDLTDDHTSEEVFREQLGRDHTVSIVQGRNTMGWSDAVNLGRESLPADGWVWVLRDDTTPDAGALKALMTTVDGAPSVVMAGPKQRMADEPSWLREFGETTTRWGQRQAIVERELDQGQYDRMSDVLAVGDAGALMSLSVFDELGGADTGLDPLDAPLDLGLRARLAGHRVVAVPAAIVFVERGPADWRAGKKLGSAHMYRLDRHAWIYRRFAYSPWWALVPLVLWTLPLSAARAAWHFATKRPDFAVADLIASVSALVALPRAIVAKSRIDQSRAVGWSAIRPLEMSPTERRRRRQLEAEAKFARAEERAQVLIKPAFWPAGLWLILGLAVFGVLLSGPLMGSSALVGGGLLPLSSSLSELWSEVRWLQPASVGEVWGNTLVPADPGVLVLALIGSLTWWSPSLAIVWAWVAAPLVSGLVAWWSAGQLLRRQVPTTVFAVLWVLQPAFLSSLAEGRVYGVLLHIALPWLVATALTAHTSWQRAAQAGVATAVVTALAPSLWPAVVLGWLVIVLVTGWRQPLRAVAGTLPLALIPALVLSAPRILASGSLALVPGLGRFVADPGVALTSEPLNWWHHLVGWSSTPHAPALLPAGIDWSLITLVLALPLVALAVMVFTTPRGDLIVTSGLLVAAGLLTAVGASTTPQGYLAESSVTVWSGSGALLAGLGLVLAASAALDQLIPERFEFGKSATLRRVAGGSIVLVVAASSLIAVAGEVGSAWRDDSTVRGIADARTLPALVTAESLTTPNQNTLVIDQIGESFRASVVSGSGQVLDRHSSVYRLRPVEPSAPAYEIASVVAAIVQPSSADPLPMLRERGIRFILFTGDPESEAALAMGRRADFIPSGQTANALLWKVEGVGQSRDATLAPSAQQAGFDALLWITFALWGILALPTERTPRRHSSEGDDENSLAALLEEDADE